MWVYYLFSYYSKQELLLKLVFLTVIKYNSDNDLLHPFFLKWDTINLPCIT